MIRITVSDFDIFSLGLSLVHMVIKSISSCALLKILKNGSTYACIRRKNNGRKASSQGFTFFISLIVIFHKYIRLYDGRSYSLVAYT